jgi:DNA-binding CsgD family transcriptional regulator
VEHTADVGYLNGLRAVIAGPLGGIAPRFSRFLADRWPHTALVIFTRECTGRPRKVAGPAAIVDRIGLDELDQLKSVVPVGRVFAGQAGLAARRRWVWAVLDATDTLLALLPRSAETEPPSPDELAALFAIVATAIRHQVALASPDYLAESRAASTERARAIAEMTAAHEAALISVLATLRSPALDDGHARAGAAEVASTALVALRSAHRSARSLAEEPACAAYARLRRDIEPLLRGREVDVDFAAPDGGARPIPGEIAHAARAMTHETVLAFTRQPVLARLRVAWDCVDDLLVVDVRDQHGALEDRELRGQLDPRAQTLRAAVAVEVVAGWGSSVTIKLPLAAPAAAPPDQLAVLNRRERQVLALVTAGKRNKAIAGELGITESTVKFHIAAVLRKLGVSTRVAAAAAGMRAQLLAE